MKTNQKGFTLVELLVVIGIIALLISILLPSLGRARDAAAAIKCSANLRTVVQSVIMYGAENKGAFIPLGTFGRHTTSTTDPDVSKFISPTLWEQIKIPAGSMARVCPTALTRLGDFPLTDKNKFLYSYRYNLIIGGGAAKNGPNSPGGTATLRSSPPPGQTGTDKFFDTPPYRSVSDSSNVIMFVDAPQVIFSDVTNNAQLANGVLRPANPLRQTRNGETHQVITEIAATHFKPIRTQGNTKYYNNGEVILAGYTNIAYCDGSVRSVLVTGGNYNASENGGGSGTVWPNIFRTSGMSRSVVENSKLDPTIPW